MSPPKAAAQPATISLWTIPRASVAAKLLRRGEVTADPLRPNDTFPSKTAAYQWMAARVAARVGRSDIIPPIWLWPRHDDSGRHLRTPPMRRAVYSDMTEQQVRNSAAAAAMAPPTWERIFDLRAGSSALWGPVAGRQLQACVQRINLAYVKRIDIVGL